jgi:ABC-type lipoprotein export system ATPase subunit
MRRLVVNSIVVAFVLPLRITAWAAGGLGADRSATQLRALTAGVPIAAYVVTGVVWFFLLHSGIFYPVFDAGNLQNSWGGPTLAGAWVVHLALALALLLVVAVPFALWRARRRDRSLTQRVAEPARSRADLRFLSGARTFPDRTEEEAMTKPGGVLVRARQLRKDYGRGEALVRAVDDVDLEVANGEALAVMGPSGCGKSTLLHLLGGLDRPTSGELWLGKRRIDQLSEHALAELRRHDVGFVFQAFHLMDELTAQENVELPALLAGRSPRQARRRARQLLDQVGLADRGDHLPSALSGGQRQRVAIARALANEPRLVLADEPTGNLDSAAALEVLRLFESLHAGGLTLVVVTHDERTAATADRLITMRDGVFVDETRLVGGTARRG